MQFNKRALSFFDIMLVVILLGILLYFAFQGYYKWAESFQAQEAINRLKSVKSNIELCIYKAASLEEINKCILSPTVHNSNSLHFNCCQAVSYTSENKKIEYSINATRNDLEMVLNDNGGEEPNCGHPGKNKDNFASGIVLCRNSDGTQSIEGWGFYKGIYQ